MNENRFEHENYCENQSCGVCMNCQTYLVREERACDTPVDGVSNVATTPEELVRMREPNAEVYYGNVVHGEGHCPNGYMPLIGECDMNTDTCVSEVATTEEEIARLRDPQMELAGDVAYHAESNYGQHLMNSNEGQSLEQMSGIMPLSAIFLQLNQIATISITSGGRREVRFTAPSTGTFTFTTGSRSATNIDPVAWETSWGNTFVPGGGLGTGTMFTFQRFMTAGQTFTFFAGLWQNANISGWYQLTVTGGGGGGLLPQPPANVWISGLSQNAISISWSAVSGATSYQIFRNGMLESELINTAFTSWNLMPGTSHSFFVRSRNSAGTSGNSVTVWGTTTPVIAAPTVATNNATNINSTQALLHGNITANGGASVVEWGFEFGLTTSLGTRVSHFGSTLGGSYQWNLSGLLPNRTYFFRAFARNSQGTGVGITRTFTTAARCRDTYLAGILATPMTGNNVHCNFFAQAVMNHPNINAPLPTGSSATMLNQLLHNNFPPWFSVSWSEAQARANQGHPTIAITSDHVAVVRPHPGNIVPPSIRYVRLAQTGGTHSHDIELRWAWAATVHDQIRFYSVF